MDFNLNNENDQWELSLDIDDSDLHLTPVLRPSSSIRVEPSPSTPNPVRIMPGPASIVQAAKLLKQKDIPPARWAGSFKIPNGNTIVANENKKEDIRIIKDEEDNMIVDKQEDAAAANKKKRGRTSHQKQQQDSVESRRWSSR
ncbi:hypothetical protein Tco_1424764, partial [Tanacetum coccineum]